MHPKKAQSFNLEIQEAIVSDENGNEIGECEEKSECENVKPCYTVDYKMKIREVRKSEIENLKKHYFYDHIIELQRHLKTGAGEKSIEDEIVVEAVKPNHIDLSVDLLETCDDCAKNVSLIVS